MKEFKRCPRCNFKTPINMPRCGSCGLDYNKFNKATNTEAKSAFRMGEKERVLHTKHIPSDVDKVNMFLTCMFGGWFGLHYFKLGKIWRGLFQIAGLILAIVYSYFTIKLNIRTGFLGNFILVCGIIWASSVVIWIVDTVSILFNKFKYPVSLPYSNTETDKGE